MPHQARLQLNSRDALQSLSIHVTQLVCRVQDVISPLLRVGDLRKQGVTLHLEIENNREEVIPSCILYYFQQHFTQVGDVAAIYFVKPDEATVQRIAADVGRRL